MAGLRLTREREGASYAEHTHRHRIAMVVRRSWLASNHWRPPLRTGDSQAPSRGATALFFSLCFYTYRPATRNLERKSKKKRSKVRFGAETSQKTIGRVHGFRGPGSPESGPQVRACVERRGHQKERRSKKERKGTWNKGTRGI